MRRGARAPPGSVLVVVDVVPRVEMLAVAIVHVVPMRDGRMAAVRAVDVHVPRVRLVDRLQLRDDLVHMIGLEVMQMPVVEVVEMVVMRDRRVAAPRIVGVRVVVVGVVRDGRGMHRRGIVAHLRADAPNRDAA